MKRLKKKIFSKNKTQKLNNKKGMTYVELLCALSLLMLIVVMFSPMLLKSYDSLYKAGEKTYTIYGEKKELEKGLTFRGKHDDVADGIEVNFKTFSTVILIKAKQVVTSMPGLETLYSDFRGKIAVPTELSLPDNQDAQIIKMKFSDTSFTEDDIDSEKLFITDAEPTADKLSDGKIAYQFKSAFNPDKDFSEGADFVKYPNMDTENAANYDPNIHIMIKGVDITDSPIRVRIYYLSGGAVKYSESHYYITPADMMFVGDAGTADYFTSAGVSEDGEMLVAGRDFQTDSIASGMLNDVKWISETNDSTLVDGYYMMCGENSVVRRLWHFNPATLSVGSRSTDFSSLLSTGAHYVYGGDVAYPFKWAGDYTDTYSLSVNGADSVYEDAQHNYSLNGSYMSYGYNGYTVNAGSLNNGIWAPSEIAARNRRISYIMSGTEEEAKTVIGNLSRDGFLTKSYHRDGTYFWWEGILLKSEGYDHYTNTGNHDNSGSEYVYSPSLGVWVHRTGNDSFSPTSVEGYNKEGSWFDNDGENDNAYRYNPKDHDHTNVQAFNVRNSAPSGNGWGVNEEVNASNDKDITCLILKAYNNYDINHLTSNTYQGVSGNKKVNMTSCVALPGKGGESICFGTTQAYALINTTTPRDPELSMAGYIKAYKIEGVGSNTYAKTYAQDTSGFDEVAAALQDYAGNYDIDQDKARQLAHADSSSPSNGGILYSDTYFTMGYSSNLSAVYDKFIKDNSAHLEKPLESIYLASKNTTAIDDGYHNMWLTREFYNLTTSDTYNKSVVAAGYNVAGAVKAGYKKTMYAPFSPDNDKYRDEALLAYHTADGIINPPAPGTDNSIWHLNTKAGAKNKDYYGLDFRGKYDYTNTMMFWVQLPMATVSYTDLTRMTNDAVLSVYTEGVKTFAPILYYKEDNGSSVRFNSVSVTALNDNKVGVAAGTSNGKIFIVFPDYVDGVISSAPIIMGDGNGKYAQSSAYHQMYDMKDSFASVDAVKVCNVYVDGTTKFCLFFAGKSVANDKSIIGVATFNSQTGGIETYQEHALTGAGDANIKDICVSDGRLYAVGCKAGANNADINEGVIYSCDVKELVANTIKGDITSTSWITPVTSYAKEFSAKDGKLIAKTTGTLPILKAAAATHEED